MSVFTVYVTPAAWKEIKKLPGHVRQRVKKMVEGLAKNPRPAKAKRSTFPICPAKCGASG